MFVYLIFGYFFIQAKIIPQKFITSYFLFLFFNTTQYFGYIILIDTFIVTTTTQREGSTSLK